MTTVFEVLYRKAEPYKVKLVKGQRETYGWEITVYAPDSEMALIMLNNADKRLRQVFGGGSHGE